MRKRTLTVVLMVVTAVALRADTPTRSQVIDTVTIQRPPGLLDSLGKSYSDGNWSQLQADIIQTVNGQKYKGGSVDVASQYYFVLFITDAHVPDGELVRVLVHSDVLLKTAVAPYATSLPGLGNIVELYISDVPRERAESFYVSKETPNPLFKQLAKAAALIDLGKVAALASSPGRNTTVPYFMTVSEVPLPFVRSEIDVESRVITTRTVGDLRRDVHRVASRAKALEGFTSTCALGFIAEVEKAKPLDPRPDTDDLTGSDSKTLLVDLQTRYEAFVSTCTLGATTKFEEQNVLRRVYDSVADAIKGSPPDKIEGKFSYHNATPNRYALVSIAGGLFGTGGSNKQYKIDGGKLVSDPVAATTAIVGVNIFASRVVSGSETRVASEERFRGVVGLNITPSIGVSVGVGALLVPGLSINVGYSWLSVHGLRKGESANAAPVSTNPLRRTIQGSPFIGFGYNFD